MAIQIPNPGTGNGATGDNEFVLWSKVKDNFTDQTNAASRLVGNEDGNVAIVQARGYANAGLGATSVPSMTPENMASVRSGFYTNNVSSSTAVAAGHAAAMSYQGFMHVPMDVNYSFLLQFPYHQGSGNDVYYKKIYNRSSTGSGSSWYKIYSTANTTKDSNGMIKASSPVLRVFSAHIEGNEDGEKMGAKFVKNSVGNYLIKGTTGLADEGWYVTVPQDANGNNLVAVEYESLENGDVVLRTYKRKFDFETVSIVADHDNPLDIPDTRWVDLRFNEIPVEMPDNIQPEEAGLEK